MSMRTVVIKKVTNAAITKPTIDRPETATM